MLNPAPCSCHAYVVFQLQVDALDQLVDLVTETNWSYGVDVWQKFFSFKLVVLALTISIIFVIYNFILAYRMRSFDTSVYLAEHKQLFDDWTSQPFTDIILIPEKECPQDYEALLYQVWSGTNDICRRTNGEEWVLPDGG